MPQSLMLHTKLACLAQAPIHTAEIRRSPHRLSVLPSNPPLAIWDPAVSALRKGRAAKEGAHFVDPSSGGWVCAACGYVTVGAIL